MYISDGLGYIPFLKIIIWVLYNNNNKICLSAHSDSDTRATTHTHTLGGEHYPTFSCHVVVFSNSFSITLKLIFQWISYFFTMILWKYYVQCTLLKIPKKWVNYELWQTDKIIWFSEVSLSDVFYFNFVHLNINFEYIYINFRYIYIYTFICLELESLIKWAI